MELFNLLSGADVAIGLFGETYDVYLNWIGKIIQWLITGVGSVGVGIILFSLVLKLIVLPFDIYQRVAMRKQNIKMKENQAKMEKLQKQYANNKEMYNQKVMEMYKESGISMFSSCLPMILSMVIFIVAINAFNAYSQYSNIENYNTMVDAYNKGILAYAPELNAENVSDDGTLITVKDENGADKYIYYTLAVPKDENGNAVDYTANEYQYIKETLNAKKSFFIDVDKANANEEIKAYVETAVANGAAENADVALKAYFSEQGQDAVVVAYDEEVRQHTKFLWIKNIWVTDAMYKNPVLEYEGSVSCFGAEGFKNQMSREKFDVNGKKMNLTEISQVTNAYNVDQYNIVTGKLDAQKGEANGYFILVVLSIGTILLQQFVSMRSQKEQQKYSSVDGQGASQQKMMMIMMTGMFAIFSFSYSSAFSIYMIMSNLFSLVSTLIINKAVDTVEDRKERAALIEKHSRRLPGRGVEKKDNEKKK